MKAIIAGLAMLGALAASAESKIICTVQTEAPIEITAFVDGWQSGAHWGTPPTYYKDVNGTVRLAGLIYKYTAGSNGVAFTLPAGYRPLRDERLPITNGAGESFVFVSTSGDVWIVTGGDNAMWVSLSGVTFRAQ